MVIVAEELPFVAVVKSKRIDTVCSNCFAVKNELNKIKLKRCGGCELIYYCSKECQKEDHKFHKDECQKSLFKFFGFGPCGDEVRMMYRLIMRVERGDLPVAFNGRTFDDLMDHKDEVLNDASKTLLDESFKSMLAGPMSLILGNVEKDLFKGANNQIMAFIYQIINLNAGYDCPSFEEFLPLYGKCMTNSFDILSDFNQSLGTALYLGLAAHNHSCRPSAEYHFNGSKIVLRALDPNSEYSKNLTISYIPILRVKEDRQKQLRSKYYFDCECDRCADDELELWERSGYSRCCPSEGAVLPVEPLICTNCGEEADSTLERINTMNENLVKLIPTVEKLLAKNDPSEEPELLATFFKWRNYMGRAGSPYNLIQLKHSELLAALSSKMGQHPVVIEKYHFMVKKASEKYPIDKTMSDDQGEEETEEEDDSSMESNENYKKKRNKPMRIGKSKRRLLAI